MRPRLKSGIWVSALLRRAQAEGAFATVLRKGDEQAGITLIIIRNGESLSLYAPERDFSGDRLWWRSDMADQTELDSRLNRRVDEDPDIWIVEIETTANPETLIEEPVRSSEAYVDDPAKAAAQALFRGQ